MKRNLPYETTDDHEKAIEVLGLTEGIDGILQGVVIDCLNGLVSNARRELSTSKTLTELDTILKEK